MNERKIPLMRGTFFKESIVKERLVDFISSAKFLSMGEQCKKFEEAFARFQGRAHAVFVSSGSAANLVLIQALLNTGKLKRGDRVAVSALTWSTNIMPLIQLGLVPVLIDCEKQHLNISSSGLIKVVEESNVVACFLTNLLGFCGDLNAMRELCRERKILLIEDNCESLGSEAYGEKLGNFGLASTFSFFVGHHLSTIEGGMVCTNDAELATSLIMARAHGWDRNIDEVTRSTLRRENDIDDFYGRYTFYDLAFNVRPTDIQGFIGLTQMEYVSEIITRREKYFRAFHEAVSKNTQLTRVDVGHMDVVSNFAYPVICSSVEIATGYKKRCRERNIEIRPIVAGNMAEQPFFHKYVSENQSCPIAHAIHQTGFYVPNHPDLTQEEEDRISEILATPL